MPLPKPEMVLFDLDGTLVDTAPDLADCVNAMLERLGMPGRGEAQVRCWIGNGVERLVKRALTNDFTAEPDPALFNRALPLFMEIYSANSCPRSTPYPGVRALLSRLRQGRLRLGCVTNKRTRFTDKLLKKLGLYDEFDIIVSGDTLPEMKPHPLPLLHAARSFAIDPERVVMVGDSRNDIEAARAAGCRVFCVTYGYNHGFDIRAAGPDRLLETLMEFPELT